MEFFCQDARCDSVTLFTWIMRLSEHRVTCITSKSLSGEKSKQVLLLGNRANEYVKSKKCDVKVLLVVFPNTLCKTVLSKYHILGKTE